MKKYTLLYIGIFFILMHPSAAPACTSMIIGAENSTSGRPLLWKHRDTGVDNNFIAKIEPTDSTAGYIGLFNAGDSLYREAWMGMNDRGFAIMNTASYNLPEFESELTDREAIVMSEALKYCTTLGDFEALLERLPKPLGVQANFGVIDAFGGAAYFETSDSHWTRFDVSDSSDGYLIRTNHSLSGTNPNGRGYIRYATAQKLAAEHEGTFSPYDLTDGMSCQFYHSLLKRDFANDSIVADLDFIPRNITTASLVVEGVVGNMNPTDIRMWGCLGYPPCAISDWITFKNIPDGFLPMPGSWRSEACDRAMELRRSALPYQGAEGQNYLNIGIIRHIMIECREQSSANFNR